jgi:shikimate kinase
MVSRNLCLVGMPGAGKTSVANVLGERLGRRVADTDEEIRRWTGATIPELFEQRGEAGFRELERQVIVELARFQDLILSLGGGAVLRDDNVSELLLTGVIVHLDVSPEVIIERLSGDTDRPLLADDLPTQVRATHAARHGRYLEVADTSIDAHGSPDQVAEAVLAWVFNQGDVLTPSEHEQVMT